MTIENKRILVNALAQGDTEPLSNLVNVLGGSNQVLEFFTNTLAISANGDPVKMEAAVVFIMALEKMLQRIQRQKAGAEILKSINV